MGWLFGRSAATPPAEAAAIERLERLARQWRPVPDPQIGLPPQRDRHQQSVPPRVRMGGWTPAATRALALIVIACLAVAGWWWWSGQPREVVAAPTVLATGAPIDVPRAPASSAAAVSAEVVVHVTGLVSRPGLVSLPAGSRVADAVVAAGGVTKRRAADSVNLARLLVDGEQIVVTDEPAANPPALAPSESAQPVISLNTADQVALEKLPGIGPVIAARIVEWRAANGPFRSVDELGEVSGIGDATLVRLRSLVGL